MTDNYLRKAGRPTQPYCPDCRKELPPRYEPKEPGQGYCKNHQRIRVRQNYTIRKRQADPGYLHPEERASVLDADIKAHVKRVGAENVDLKDIKQWYFENGLAPLPDAELTSMYLRSASPPRHVDTEDDPELMRALGIEVNPYD